MTDLKNGMAIVLDNMPYAVLSVKHLHMGRGGSSSFTRLRNLATGQILERNFKQADRIEEADIEKVKSIFLYSHRGEFWFVESNNPKNRFTLKNDILGDIVKFLKNNLEIIALKFNGKIINIELPVTADYKVSSAPPGIRGNTSQGGSKPVIIETGAQISAPLFISEGDIIRVNTESGEYTKRVEKI